MFLSYECMQVLNFLTEEERMRRGDDDDEKTENLNPHMCIFIILFLLWKMSKQEKRKG